MTPTSARARFTRLSRRRQAKAHSADERAKNKLQRTQINGRGAATDTAAVPRLFLCL